MQYPSRRQLLAASALALVRANGGAAAGAQPWPEWHVGCRHYLLWPGDALPPTAAVRIEASFDNAKSFEPIAEKAPNTGRYLWTVPDRPAAECAARIVPSGGGEPLARTGFAIVRAAAPPRYRWELVTHKAPFAPRDGAGALVFKGRMWLLGGWNPLDKKHFPRICNNEVWSSQDGVDWTLEKPNTFLDNSFDPTNDWEGRHTAGYVVFKNRMWIVGGDPNQGHYQFDVWNSADGKKWELVNQGRKVPWGPRCLHHTVAFRDRIWVIGGQTTPEIAKADAFFYRDVWSTADGIHWEKVDLAEPAWPQRGMIGGQAVLNDRIWLLGGGQYLEHRLKEWPVFNDVWSSCDGRHWQRHTAAAPWDPRQYHEVAAFDNRLWVLEGYHRVQRNKKDVWHSADGVNWHEVPDTPWKPRHAASVFVHDGSLWMVTGNNMESDVWRLRRMTS